MLLLNRIEAQTILTDCTDFSLDEQLRQCILVTRQKWREKPLQFEAELAPCTYHGSEALVKEIWLNLLDNAAQVQPGERNHKRNTALRAGQTGCGCH